MAIQKWAIDLHEPVVGTDEGFMYEILKTVYIQGGKPKQNGKPGQFIDLAKAMSGVPWQRLEYALMDEEKSDGVEEADLINYYVGSISFSHGMHDTTRAFLNSVNQFINRHLINKYLVHPPIESTQEYPKKQKLFFVQLTPAGKAYFQKERLRRLFQYSSLTISIIAVIISLIALLASPK